MMQIILNVDKVYMILDEMIIEGYISETNQDRILAPLQLLDTVRKWYLSSNAADLTDVFTMNKGPLGSQEEVIEGSSWQNVLGRIKMYDCLLLLMYTVWSMVGSN
jgi:hypothetical protein